LIRNVFQMDLHLLLIPFVCLHVTKWRNVPRNPTKWFVPSAADNERIVGGANRSGRGGPGSFLNFVGWFHLQK
jgi:hypothetical protein